MYVLAQFSEDSPFDWIARLRAKIGKDELKHADYLHAQLLYTTDSQLWKTVERGLSEASIFVVDPHTYITHLIPELLNSGMEYGIDFDWADVLQQAAEKMISETPAYELTNSAASMELARLVSERGPLYGMLAPRTLPLPSEVLKRLGGKIRDALRFVARANAVFEFALEEPDASFDAEDHWLRSSPYVTTRRFELVVQSTLSTRRIFDKEDDRSVRVIAETADTLARYSFQLPSRTLYIKEEDSRNANALQAADIAAGVARTLIDANDFRALARKFRKVWINGVNLHQILR